MAIETERFSPVTTALNQRLADGISPTELAELQQLARSGSVLLVDVRNTEADVRASATLSHAQKAQVLDAVHSMREILESGPANGEQGTSLEWIATLDPFARAASDLRHA
jgi:hypothetical protein